MTRGDIYDVPWPRQGLRPAVIVTRPTAIPYLANVTVALVTTRVRGLPTEVQLGVDHGVVEGSVANCDNLETVPKTELLRRRGALGPIEERAVNRALLTALALD